MANLNQIRQIMRAEKVHQVRRMEMLRQTPSGKHYTIHEIAGSVTSTTAAKYGRKLNVTVGLGLFGPVSRSELETIIRTYNATGLPPELDICVSVPPAIFALLSSYSFVRSGTIETFERTLSGSDLDADPSVRDTEITVSETTDVETFVRASVAGFRSGGRSDELLGLLARAAAERTDTTLFLAHQGRDLAGSAGMSCIDVVDGDGSGAKFALFHIDSTLPDFRGLGVHAALLKTRLKVAKATGRECAIASARTGSASARNIVRAGFASVFESTTYTKLQ